MRIIDSNEVKSDDGDRSLVIGTYSSSMYAVTQHHPSWWVMVDDDLF
jgi:hypothetical protein